MHRFFFIITVYRNMLVQRKGCKIHSNQLVLETYLIPTDIYATVAAETGGGGAEEFLLRPQRTPRRSPSMSSPFAHASAARSADVRSLKLTNAHLDFATWTIERKDVGSTPGNDLMTCVRTVCSVADAGKEERNNDITDSSSGGLSPWSSACPAKILRATGSLFPKYLSWIFCFDSSLFTGISCR